MLIPGQIISERALTALTWTLVHSLWQGCLLAIAAGAVLVCSRRVSSHIRYVLLTSLLFLFISVVVLTFLGQWTGSGGEREPTSAQFLQTFQATGTPDNGITKYQQVSATANWMAGARDFLDMHASWIVCAWFVVFSFRFIRLFTSVRDLRRLRRLSCSMTAGFGWQHRLSVLAVSLGIKRDIGLAESPQVKVPMASGIWRPLILVPLGMFAQLSPEETEAVLLHELAHIRRGDYIVNLVQHMAEAVLFFNPALLWVSALIREERENCCDDLSLAVTGSETILIRALVTFQEKNLKTAILAPAFAGRKNHLLNRINRLLTRRNYTLDNLEKTLLAAGVLAGGFLVAGFSGRHTDEKTPPSAYRLVLPGAKDIQPIAGKEQSAGLAGTKRIHVGGTISIRDTANDSLAKAVFEGQILADIASDKSDTIPAPGRIEKDNASDIKATLNDKKYRIVESEGKVIALFIDGKKIPDEMIPQYKADIDKIHGMLKQYGEQRYALKLAEEELQRQQEKMKGEQDALKENLLRNLDQIKTDSDMQAMVRAKKNLALAQDQLLKQSIDQVQQEELLKKLELMSAEAMRKASGDIKANEQLLKDREMMDREQKLALENILKSNQDLRSAQDAALQAEISRLREKMAEGTFAPGERSIRSVIDDLVEGGIISGNAKTLSFTLNNRELIVNGKKQPDEVFRKFRKKFIRNPKDHFIYSHSGSSTNSDTWLE
jgi:beta-lactamase regulating signal transducer with metallopeptidase domain